MASPLRPVIDEIKTGFDKFDPQGPTDLIDFFMELPELFEGQADSLSNLAGRMDDEMPLDPRLAEKLREMASIAAGLRDEANELHTQFRAAHAKEIQRVEEPRAGEEAWDVRNAD